MMRGAIVAGLLAVALPAWGQFWGPADKLADDAFTCEFEHSNQYAAGIVCRDKRYGGDVQLIGTLIKSRGAWRGRLFCPGPTSEERPAQCLPTHQRIEITVEELFDRKARGLIASYGDTVKCPERHGRTIQCFYRPTGEVSR